MGNHGTNVANYGVADIVRISGIKHLSFDVRKTLINASKTFRNANLDMMMEKFNDKNRNCDDITKVMNVVKKRCDHDADHHGVDHGTYALWKDILTFTMGRYDQQLFEEYYAEREKLFLEHLPPLYDETVKDTLLALRGAGYTMSILSNTGLTAGETLEKMLVAHDIAELFDFKLYSDQIETAKPSNEAFSLVHQGVNKLHEREVNSKEIIHIGDNPKADIGGAKSYGMQSVLINTTTTPFISLQQLIS